VALPLGLTFMTLLAPFFYFWVLLKRKKEILLPFVTVLLPFIIVHVFITGVDLKSYVLSTLNIIMIYIFCQAFYTFLRVHPDPERIFRKLLILNFVLCLLGILFYFTPYDRIFWIRQTLSEQVFGVHRFRMFTYEASYYAMLFAPLFVFYWLQYTFVQNRIKNQWLIPMIFLPLLLSFSLGVITALLLAGLITFLIYFPLLIRKRRVVNSLIYAALLTVSIAGIMFLFFKNNPFFLRLLNLIEGDDTSGNGRTIDAFILTGKIIKEKSELWGIGPGELKYVGKDIIQGYYLYKPDAPVAIPNAAAETWLLFGWVGLVFRLGIQFVLFFYTKVWKNYYRLMLFLFVFIYQFTGSYITNPAEYVIWILAFTNVFSQFDVVKRIPQSLVSGSSSSLHRRLA
jgi:hypothetical protein